MKIKPLAHIAVIDDGINENRYKNIGKLWYNVEISTDLIIRKRTDYDRNLYSHGTTCATIIKKYAENAVLSSIKILNSQTQKCLKAQLIMAINWCVDKGIRVINLSLGTTYFKDFNEIVEVVELACLKGTVIVASCSNRNIYTCPASLNNVIGVRSDEKNHLREGEFVFNSFYPDGIEITACGKYFLKNYLGEQELTQISNSYATPRITAFIYQIICNDANITTDEIKKILKMNGIKRKLKNYCIRNRYLSGNLGIPVMVICGQREETVCRMVGEMSDLFKYDGYNSVAIMDSSCSGTNNNVFHLCNYLEGKNLSLNIKVLRVICSVHEPNIIILGSNIKNGILNKGVKVDAKVVIDPPMLMDKHLFQSCEELIVISDSYTKCNSMKSQFKIFKENEIKELYKHTMHMFEG